jgi:hypothetical protein
MLNFNDTVPAAPAGGANVLWQEDAAGNTSAYILSGSLAGGRIGAKTTIAPVANVLTVDASLGNTFLVNVNAQINSMSITNPTDGQEITLLWQQDGSGHTIALAANLVGATAPTTTASKISCQKFTYNVGTTNWYAIAAGSVNM